MKESIKLGFILLILCAVSAGLLAIVNSYTAPVIMQNELKETLASYQTIYGEDAEEVTPVDQGLLKEVQEKFPDIDNVFEVKKGGNLIGYGINVKGNGFGGEMTNALGFYIENKTIAGFRNIVNAETKGFGTRIADETYYSSYNGKSAAGDLTISKDPSAENQVLLMTGATVTSKAVLEADNVAIQAFNYLLAK